MIGSRQCIADTHVSGNCYKSVDFESGADPLVSLRCYNYSREHRDWWDCGLWSRVGNGAVDIGRFDLFEDDKVIWLAAGKIIGHY